VWVEHPPFNMAISKSWEIPLTANSLLRTVLIARMPDPRNETTAS
jgi:hypothetical protein